ncbi:MAG TPA: FG-GAP-like repeat-containing protein [Planctomycetaceae bacterium]|nr:FG-GAP-like repeat-containing protein [Planctomycetaceae bacterium]
MIRQIRLIAALLWLAGTVSGVGAGELRFVAHVLDAEATNCACAAVNVNRDGRLDVVAGGWWYEAPTWRRHHVRDVEVIRGRFDDYSNLPLDVNGDGWTDLVSANYRSGKLYWIQHPGAAAARAAGPGAGGEAGAEGGPTRPATWPVHLIAEPGPMETARLADIDGDGRLDVLPNGVRFAAWWELVREGQAGGGSAPIRWVRHELPAELAAHGVGFGDIDGDGRGDVVGPAGWAAQPDDPRRERWPFHAEFRLHRDASVPILVVDVDGDGDNDVVWARAHNTGIYWLENVAPQPAASATDATSATQGASAPPDAADAQRRWVFHAIDTSWSQAHSLLWGDIDNDGRPELIAGKRYLGHDGKDLGEYDPLIICASRFDPQQKTWQRQVLCESWRVGFGLDPKLVDLDGDGDLDLICPGRSGLYWLENRLASREKTAAEPGATIATSLPAAAYADHASLLVYRDSDGRHKPVSSPAEWAVRRSHILASIAQVTGPLPEPSRRVPLELRVIEEHQTERYARRKVTFAVEPGDRASAYLLIPHRLSGPAPAMLCLHQTTDLGKDEPAGLGGRATLHYAHELANRGYVCLVPDHPGFGESPAGTVASGEPSRSGSGTCESGLMKAVWNAVRGIDLLESLPEVDRDRIGCIGHSLGAHTGLFTAVFDQRIGLVVSSCGFTAFADDDVESWSGPRYMPRIASVYGNDAAKLPFDFHEVVAALAPRPVFVNAPLHDADFSAAGVRKVIASAAAVYEVWNASDKLTVVHPDSEHNFPDDVREQCYEWIDARWK